MNEQIQDMMEEAGIGRNVVEVFDDPDGSVKLLYPNHMVIEFIEQSTIEKEIDDQQWIEIIEQMMIDHIEECKVELGLLRDYQSWKNER